MASAAGIGPTSCWCAGRPSSPTGIAQWRRWRRRCLMRVAVYARVSTTRQAQAQSIEQQLDRLRAAVAARGWTLEEQHVYRDDGYSGASLGRPGLDRLRDHAALADLDVVVVTAPDRLARNYVHQVLLVDELGRHGLKVEFLDHPMSQDPTTSCCCRSAVRSPSTSAPWSPSGCVAAGRPGCGPARCCRGPARRSATGWTPSVPARRPGCGWSPARRCWWRSCSTGTWRRRRPCTSSPSG